MKACTKEELTAALDRVAGTPILVVGDLILDRYIWGKVERISPEAPVPIVEVVKTDDRAGGAGNVVANLVAIGAKPSVCGLVGDDEDGARLIELFKDAGADCSGVVVDKGYPTVLKTRVIAHTQQIVRIDREQRSAASAELLERMASSLNSRIDASSAVVMSDYGKGTVSSDVLAVLHAAAAAKRLGLSSRPLFVDPHPRNYEAYRAMSVAKPNRKEAEIASGVSITSVSDAFRAADILMKKWNSEMMVVTLGEDGMIVQPADGAPGIHLETTAQEVFDVSGAGDTVTAVFCSALATGSSPTIAGVLANIAAGIVVSEVGTVPVDIKRLRQHIANWGES
jgi:rfaE bifunctional protein kinase chain/domain